MSNGGPEAWRERLFSHNLIENLWLNHKENTDFSQI